MNKTELIKKLAQDTGITMKDAKLIVDTFFSSIQEALENGDRVELRGFGTFYIHTRKARKGRNPRTGTPVDIPEKKVPRFKPGSVFKRFMEN